MTRKEMYRLKRGDWLLAPNKAVVEFIEYTEYVRSKPATFTIRYPIDNQYKHINKAYLEQFEVLDENSREVKLVKVLFSNSSASDDLMSGNVWYGKYESGPF